MLSRRAFLGGTAIAAVGGTYVVSAVGWRQALHRVGLVESPDHRVPESGWLISEFALASLAMDRQVTWAVARPPVTVPLAGVVICLHGRGGSHRDPFDDIHLHDVAAFAGTQIAIVGVDGGADSYWHARADGSDAMSMVVDELMPAVDELLGVALPHALIGWSMGGYGALLLAERQPALFRAVAAASPALWLTAAEAADGAFDDDADYARNDVFLTTAALSTMQVRVDCGTDDDFVEAARTLAGRLPAPNLGAFGPGFHDDAYWRSIAPAQIATIAAAFAAG